jgi:hypothetical protein
MIEGVELMKKLHEGRLNRVTSKELEGIKQTISMAIDEILTVGARIRPLHKDGKKVGFVRGVYPSERRKIRRWLDDPSDYMEEIVRLGTTLPQSEIDSLSLQEIRTILQLILQMTESDLRLYPFLSAFVSTSISEQTWASGGTLISAKTPSDVVLPGGKSIRFEAVPDHTTLWATLCTQREHNKVKLDQTMNSLLIIRPWVGKGANAMSTSLQEAARALQPDSDDPWTQSIKVTAETDVSDGWAHLADDAEGMVREASGFFNGDKHERFMEITRQHEKEKAEAQAKKVDRAIREYTEGVASTQPVIMTSEEATQRMNELRMGRTTNSGQTDFTGYSGSDIVKERYN